MKLNDKNIFMNIIKTNYKIVSLLYQNFKYKNRRKSPKRLQYNIEKRTTIYHNEVVSSFPLKKTYTKPKLVKKIKEIKETSTLHINFPIPSNNNDNNDFNSWIRLQDVTYNIVCLSFVNFIITLKKFIINSLENKNQYISCINKKTYIYINNTWSIISKKIIDSIIDCYCFQFESSYINHHIPNINENINKQIDTINLLKIQTSERKEFINWLFKLIKNIN